jgi:hypothetical protein
MEKRLGHDALAQIVLLETHRFVDAAADEAMAKLARLQPRRADSATGAARPSTEPSPLPANVRSAIATSVEEMKRGSTLAYPPSEEGRLTDEELAALSALQIPEAARSAIRKVVRDAASASLFQLFCLLDSVGDPALVPQADWSAVNLVPAQGADYRSMMHDDFFDSYWRYVEVRGQAKA